MRFAANGLYFRIRESLFPIVLKPGEGLTSVVTSTNTTNQTVRFGLTSEDEMNFIFGYYY